MDECGVWDVGNHFHEGMKVIWVVEDHKNGGIKTEQGQRRSDCCGEIWILSTVLREGKGFKL